MADTCDHWQVHPGCELVQYSGTKGISHISANIPNYHFHPNTSQAGIQASNEMISISIESSEMPRLTLSPLRCRAGLGG